jgi:hypothetical protein
MSKKKVFDLPGQQEIQQDGSIAPVQPTNGKAPPLTPRQRFVKHAGARTSKLLSRLKAVGNLASRSSYEFTDEERDEMLAIVDAAYKAMRQRFFPAPSGQSGGRALFSWEKGSAPAGDAPGT